MAIDWTKPITLRDGRKWEDRGEIQILSGHRPCRLGVVTDYSGNQWSSVWRPDGKSHTMSCLDLINVPEKISGWFNFYRSVSDAKLPFYQSGPFPDKPTADLNASGTRIACKFIEVTEGEGL
jgi:hypothetical protein